MKLSVFAILALSASQIAIAQEPESPLPPEQAPAPSGQSPAVSYLVREYGIPETEAKERLAVQAELMELTGRLEREGDPGFRDTWIEHSPVFKVIIAFSDAKDRKALLETLPPRLRRYAQLRMVPRGRTQIKADQAAIEQAFQAAGVPFGGGFDTISGKYDIVVEDARSISAIRLALPATLRDDVTIRQGQLPRPEAAPTGVVAGDWIAGGYPLYPIKTDAQCTFGFPVRFKPTGSTTELKGVLTAGHCGNVAYHYYNGHWITFGSPVVAPAVAGSHDYKVFETTGLTDDSGNEVYYSNSSNLPGISTRSYYKVYAWAASTSQSVGNIVCKSGQQTGLTCGRITKKDGYYLGTYSWIEVVNSSHSAYQADISADGDSGGPWFFDVGSGSATSVIATGLHVAGGGVGPTATALYMPLERIDDHNTSVRLVITP